MTNGTDFEVDLRERLRQRADSIVVGRRPEIEVLESRPIIVPDAPPVSGIRWRRPVIGLAAAVILVLANMIIYTGPNDPTVDPGSQAATPQVGTDPATGQETTRGAPPVAVAEAPTQVPGLPTTTRVDPEPPCRPEFPFAWTKLPAGFASTPLYWSIADAPLDEAGVPIAPAVPATDVVSVGESANRWISLRLLGGTDETDSWVGGTDGASFLVRSGRRFEVTSAGVEAMELNGFIWSLSSECIQGGAVQLPG